MDNHPAYKLKDELTSLRMVADMLRGKMEFPLHDGHRLCFVSYQYGRNIAGLAWLIENPGDWVGAKFHQDAVARITDTLPQYSGLAALYWVHPHDVRRPNEEPTAGESALAIDYYLAHGDPHWQAVFERKAPVTVRYDDAE